MVGVSSKRKIHKMGGSFMITLPQEWIEESKFKEGDEILCIANADVKFLSRENEDKFEKIVHKEVAKDI